MCAEPPAIHCIYVKKNFRQMGIGRALIEATKHNGVWYATFWRACAEPFAKKFNIERIDL
jgi:GNAT superfamily N-acetyltransferase